MKKLFLILLFIVAAAGYLFWTYTSDRVRIKDDLIRIYTPKPGDIIGNPVLIEGEARGTWFFEASFPVKLFDENGVQISLNPPYIMTANEWMTEEFVPFEAVLEFQAPLTEKGVLVLEKDNPSGLPENADERRIPIRFR